MITDNLLIGMAKLLNSESYDIPAYLTVSSDSNFDASTTASSIPGEVGSREALSNTRSDKVVTFETVRSGATASISGDILYGVALMPSSTGDDAQLLVELPGINHTQNFDIDFNFDITLRRN